MEIVLESKKHRFHRARVGFDKTRWLWSDILWPFVLSRGILSFIGWFSQYLPLNVNYPLRSAVERGWQFSSHRLLDIWGRWDAGWYMSIVQDGYSVGENIRTVQSNIAFFPFYPYLIKFLVWFIPKQWVTREVILLVGVIVSNVLLAAALILLYKLVETSYDRQIASRSVLYILLFPTALYFSCFYTESTFLFLSVAAFYAAHRKMWLLVGLACACAALTRPNGALILLPLLWMYAESLEWHWRKIRLDIIWVFFTPLALAVFMFAIYRLAGHWLAPFQAYSAWGRELGFPWQTILNPRQPIPYLTTVEQMFMIGFILLAFASPILLKSNGYRLYMFSALLPPLLSSILISSLRYMVSAFVPFIELAIIGKQRQIHQAIIIIFASLQALFMAAWSQFYWIA